MKQIVIALLIVLTAGCARIFPPKVSSATASDRQFADIAEDFITGYLAWRPQTGTSLGFHQYDGKLTDLSGASLEAELTRLKKFDQRLTQINPDQLNPQNAYDFRILHGAVKREIFSFEQAKIYSQN